jgi:hypothetical protein
MLNRFISYEGNEVNCLGEEPKLGEIWLALSFIYRIVRLAVRVKVLTRSIWSFWS